MKIDELFGLEGKVALVTGSTRGIGRAIAETLAEAGAKVVISSRKKEQCDLVARAINDKGAKAMGMACNMSHLEQVQSLVEAVFAVWDRIDILVCNAGINPHAGPLAEIGESAYDTIMDTNVKSNLWLCNMVLPQMAQRRDGAVILVSSISAMKGNRRIGAYAISKAAILQLTRNLAVEWAPHNVRVNAIAPGVVRTDFARALTEDPEIQRQALSAYPIGRFAEPKDIVGAALLLASPAGSFITGQTLVIDGGSLIGAGGYG